MSNVWFTSDLHLGHERIIELSHRPFDSILEHDHHIHYEWNRRVGKDDIVWVLGDLSVEGTHKHALSILASLPGRKRLVTGNHDRAWVGKSDFMRFLPAYQEVFEVVTPWARAKVGGIKVLLSHFPYRGDHGNDRYPEYRLSLGRESRPLLHGHTHSRDRLTIAEHVTPGESVTMTVRVPQVHVGVDAWGFAPVSQYDVAKILDSLRARP